MQGINLAIILISDDPVLGWADELSISPGEVGEIVVWGDNVSSEYFRRSEATRLAKIESEDGIVRHRMGDLGYLDDAGRVWFCGRKSHRVQTSSRLLFSVSCEGIYNQHPDVFRSALVGIGRLKSQLPVLCVELEPGTNKEEFARIRTELFELGSATPETTIIKTILFHPKFPVDIRHNSPRFLEKNSLFGPRKNCDESVSNRGGRFSGWSDSKTAFI